MFARPLQTRGIADHVALVTFRYNRNHLRLAFGERARFIHDYRVDLL